MITSIKKTIYFLILSTFLFSSNATALSLSDSTDKVSIDIITNKDKIKSDESLLIIVKLKMLDGWHTYWDNPGETGEKTKVKWNLPKNFEDKKINFSAPITFDTEGIIQYGYNNTAYYLIELENKTLKNNDRKYKFEANISWLACREECVPEKKHFKFTIPVTQKDIFTTEQWNKEKELAFFSFPQKTNMKSFFEVNQDNNLIINIENAKQYFETSKDDIKFIPLQTGIISNNEKQIFGYDEDGNASLTIALDYYNIDELNGVLIIGKQGFELNPLQKDNLKIYKKYSLDKISSLVEEKTNLSWILFTAFIGGLILNFMPCIFPILTLKAISLVQSANNPKETKIEALAYFFGVVFSFISIATILILLRLNGEKIGWGFQLQSPIFIVIMIVIFFIIFLALLDIININNPFSSVGRLSFKKKRVNSFATGVFSVLIASPCTAPFMGIAIGYTLAKPLYVFYPVFIALSIGYALPFTLVGFFPKLLYKILPKPGKWMLVLKKIFALPILLTCIWLVWVLYNQVNVNKNEEYVKDIKWEVYSQDKVDALVDEGENIFIDFTAKWCITCLLNKKVALDSKDFAKIIKEKNVHLFKADWTNYDESIEKALNKYGRNSIPLYVYYSSSEEYKILPQIITPSILKEYIK